MSSAIRIDQADSSHKEAWNTFLSQCSNANFYQRLEWQCINHRHFNHAVNNLVATRNGEWVGVLPLVHIRSTLFGKILCSMPFVNFGGPASLDFEADNALISASCKEADSSECDYLEMRCARKLDVDLPNTSRKVSMTIELDPDPDVVWRAYKSKHRTQIRRAFKEGLTVESGGLEYLDAFYKIMMQSWRALGTPLYRKAYFREILELMPDSTRIFIVRAGNSPIATAFNGYFRDTVEGMWAAVDPSARRLNPNYALYWEMTKHACSQGYKYFHLGRSTTGSTAEQFKEKWNATAKPLYWYYHLVNRDDIPSLNTSNPRFKLAIKTWRQLPLSFTQILGPYLARRIP